jgi:radical SAM superfamily enzyme YgiQ (UPF0313 family)
MNAEVAKDLREAGCNYVQMGIQTMDDEYKYTTVKRYEKSSDVQDSMDNMLEVGLRPKVDHMFGLPGEPVSAQDSALKLYQEHTPTRVATYWTNFLPGTEMVTQAQSMGLIDQDDIDRLNEGLDFDFFRKTVALTDPKQIRLYKGYEVCFKLMPVVPKRFRKKMRPELFQYVPKFLISLMSFTVDTGFGLITGNPGHTSYAQHYWFHIKRHFRRKFGLKLKSAAPPINDEPFSFIPDQSIEGSGRMATSEEGNLVAN